MRDAESRHRISDSREWISAAVQRFEAPLIAYAFRIVGNSERARDIVQETFLKLCTQQRAAVEPRIAEWLYSVCRNHALNTKRKERRISPLSELQSERTLSTDPAPSDAAESRDSVQLILRAIEELPANQREAIRLKFEHDLSYKEISEVTNLTVTHVGFLICTGLKLLRERVQQSTRA